MNRIHSRTLPYGRPALVLAAVALLALGAWMAMAPNATAQESDTQTIELYPGWNLKGWLGPSGTDIGDAIVGNQGPAGDLTGDVTAVWTWDAPEQEWRAFFPDADFPGANDFDTFERGGSYYISYRGSEMTEWVIPVE